MPETTDGAVRYDVTSHVATITMNRPDAMNSLTTETRAELKDALHAAAADSDVRAVVLTGTGKAFCVGQDLKEHVASLQEKPIEEVWSVVASDYAPMATVPKPVIAAVNGVAAGAGASLAFAADFRILAEPASYNLAFANIALSCDTGASWTLPRLVGHAKAKRKDAPPQCLSGWQRNEGPYHEPQKIGAAWRRRPARARRVRARTRRRIPP
ncbi:MAG: enoyl-CoA hydratase/isomerase family protein, partial [Actinomycetia bacterium]|nr:enoyl-CoA hydratase/isomerase family protein [Actinomycetes bacterium]